MVGSPPSFWSAELGRSPGQPAFLGRERKIQEGESHREEPQILCINPPHLSSKPTDRQNGETDGDQNTSFLHDKSWIGLSDVAYHVAKKRSLKRNLRIGLIHTVLHSSNQSHPTPPHSPGPCLCALDLGRADRALALQEGQAQGDPTRNKQTHPLYPESLPGGERSRGSRPVPLTDVLRLEGDNGAGPECNHLGPRRPLLSTSTPTEERRVLILWPQWPLCQLTLLPSAL